MIGAKCLIVFWQSKGHSHAWETCYPVPWKGVSDELAPAPSFQQGYISPRNSQGQAVAPLDWFQNSYKAHHISFAQNAMANDLTFRLLDIMALHAYYGNGKSDLVHITGDSSANPISTSIRLSFYCMILYPNESYRCATLDSEWKVSNGGYELPLNGLLGLRRFGLSDV
jgi:hypothetical protein